MTAVSFSCDQRCRLFEFVCRTSDDETSVACFNLKKHKRLNKIYQAEIGCKLKTFNLNNQIILAQIIINGAILKKNDPNFESQEKEHKFVSVNYTNNETRLN